MISETTMTIEEAAEIGALLLNGGAGRISDDGDPKRPWLFIATSTREDAEDLYEAFGCRGFVKEKKNGRGWRYGAWGNDALGVLVHMLDAGLRGVHAALARHLLDKYGNDGKPWASEIERLRARA
jgi:hypothetical protein